MKPIKTLRKPLAIICLGVALALIAVLTWNLDSFVEPVEELAPDYPSNSTILAPKSLDGARSFPTEPLQSDTYASAQIINEPIAEQHVVTPNIPVAPMKALPTQQAAPAIKAAAPRPVTRTTATHRTSDIDVLIALMRYVESPDNDLPQSTRQALQDRIRACPKANTEAGIQCRQRICFDLPDSLELCPSQ